MVVSDDVVALATVAVVAAVVVVTQSYVAAMAVQQVGVGVAVHASPLACGKWNGICPKGRSRT